MPRANGYHRPEIPPHGGIARRSMELVLDHDFVAPKREDRTERRTIDSMIGPDLVEWLQRLSADEKDP